MNVMLIGGLLLLFAGILVGVLYWKRDWVHQHKKSIYAIIVAIVALIFGTSIVYTDIEVDVVSPWYCGSASNAYFHTNLSRNFSSIQLFTTHTKFNTTDFVISAPSRLNVTIMFINDSIIGADSSDLVVDFYANTTSGLVTFIIGGFNQTTYTVKRNGTTLTNVEGNSTGYIAFENSIWGNPRFQIYVATGPSPFAGGSGTPTDPYQITHVEHLYAVRNYLSSHFILMNDLNFSSDSSYLGAGNKTGNTTGTGWLPIGTPFTGSFNGQNYTIYDLFIDRPGFTGGGLFSNTSTTAIIINLSLFNVNVTAGDYSGGLIGDSEGDITNCSVTGKIVGETGDYGQCIGLLAGGQSYGAITKCWSSGNVSLNIITPGEGCAGGLVGWCGYAWINDSYSTADVCKLSGTGGSGIGAFLGYSSINNVVNNCFSNGSVTFVGEADPTLQGFIGNVNALAVDNYCYFDNETSNQLSSRGDATPPEGKNHTVMTNKSLFITAGWNITITTVDRNSGYPYLSWQGGPTATTWLIYEAGLGPTVVTNATTGVNSTNSTLHGFVSDDGGYNVSIVGFEYGETVGYGNTSLQSSEVFAGGSPTYVSSLYSSNLSLKTTINTLSSIYEILFDGEYFYTYGSGSYVRQFWISNNTQKATCYIASGGQALACDDTYLYASSSLTNVVHQIWKSNMTKKAATTPYIATIPSIAVDPDEGGGWYDGNWLYCKPITINHSLVEANLTDFPVLISVTDLALTAAQDDGDDFVFVLPDNTTKLSHEIESWNNTTGTLVCWVNVPTVSSVEDTIIWVYYGNDAAVNQENPTGVWDSNYEAVFHMDGSAYTEILDSTINYNHASGENGTIYYNETGIAGTAPEFGRSAPTYLAFDSAIRGTFPLTYEVWIKPYGFSRYDLGIYDYYFLSTAPEGLHAGFSAFLYASNPSTAKIMGTMLNDTNNYQAYASYTTATQITNYTWYYAVGKWDGVSTHNATYITNTTYCYKTPMSFSSYEAWTLRMGASRASYLLYFEGIIDEVRISSTERNNSWLNATYYSIATPEDFITVGEEQSPAGLYVAGGNTIYKYSTATLQKIGESSPYGTYTTEIHLAGEYLYVGGYGTGGTVYQYWRSNLTKRAETSVYAPSSWIYGIDSDGTYLYVGGSQIFKVFQYWLSNLTKKAETIAYPNTIRVVKVDDSYVYTGGLIGNTVYQFWKGNLTKRAESASIGGNVLCIALKPFDVSVFSQNISNLHEGTLYYTRASAFNAWGTGYGDSRTFLTPPVDSTGFTATPSLSTTITLNWTNGVGGDGVYVEYSVNSTPSPWNIGSGTLVNATGYLNGVTWDHASLLTNTQYYYKAWAFAADDGYMSNNTAIAPMGNSQTANTRTITPVVIRNYGLDYFVWLGANVSAWHVAQEITGFDEVAEYISVLTPTGSWYTYYGDSSGTNWTLHTFDVVKVYLTDSVGNQTIDAPLNPDINYNAERTVTLVKKGYGYNYTGYTDDVSDTLSGIAAKFTPGLATGYFVAYWDRTVFTWQYYIQGFAYNPVVTVTRYGIVMSKINIDQTWAI